MSLTVCDMKIGAQLVFGKYGVQNNDPQPIVWLKGTPNNDFITQSVLDYICFDAKEPPMYRGNPNYVMSNILSFINSSDETWYRQLHLNDRPPDRTSLPIDSFAYDTHYGFLYHFEEYEIEAILSVPVTANEQIQTKSLMRLPTSMQMIGNELLPLFKKKGVRAKGTADLIINRFNFNSYIPFWLSDNRPITNNAMILDKQCHITTLEASFSAGLRPVCTIKADTPLILNGDGSYSVKPRQIQHNVYTDEELFDFLGLTQP